MVLFSALWFLGVRPEMKQVLQVQARQCFLPEEYIIPKSVILYSFTAAFSTSNPQNQNIRLISRLAS